MRKLENKELLDVTGGIKIYGDLVAELGFKSKGKLNSEKLLKLILNAG